MVCILGEYIIYLRYMIGSNCTSILDNLPRRSMRIFSSFSTCRKALAISRVVISRFSWASTTPVRKILSVETVVNKTSNLSCPSYVCFLLTYSTFLALMSPFIFSVINISDARAFILCSIVIEDFIMGSYVSIACICDSSFCTATSASFPNIFRPFIQAEVLGKYNPHYVCFQFLIGHCSWRRGVIVYIEIYNPLPCCVTCASVLALNAISFGADGLS